MVGPGASEQEYQDALARGQVLTHIRDLAYGLAEELSWRLIEEQHYIAALADGEWRDLKMQRSAPLQSLVDQAVEFLELRELLVRHPAFPNLVRYQAPAPPADAEPAGSES